MWIKHIILKNFKGIEVGLGVRTLEIDFSKRQNKICLLVAPNGSGKTTILSCLTPFASLGNLDVRDSGDIIISGEDGYKEITIVNGMDEYLIKHFYSVNKETHSTKSYILKNGVDLNSNGNVRSFQAVVKEELGIELNYLKLIRLGNNVTNMINLSATERKSFMSNLLDELDIYLLHYKKFGEDFRKIKTVIAHTLDKLSKIDIEDEHLAELEIKKIHKQIDENESKIKTLQSTLTINQHELLELPTIDVIRTRIKELEKKIKKSDNVLGSHVLLDDYKNLQKDLEKAIITQKISIENMTKELEKCLDSIDSTIEEERDFRRELDKIENDEQRKSAERIYLELKNQIESERDKWKAFNPSYTKDEVDELLSFFMNIQEVLNTTYEFGKGPIKKVVKLLRKNQNVSGYISAKLLSMDNIDTSSSIMTRLHNIVRSGVPACEDKSCVALTLYREVQAMFQETSSMDTSSESPEFYAFMEAAFTNIKNVVQRFTEKKELIEKMPKNVQEMFLYDKFLDHIEKCEWVYDRETMYALLAEITEFENYKDKLSRYKEAETRLSNLNQSNNSEFIRSRIKAIVEQKESLNDQIDELRDSIQATSKKVVDDEAELEETIDTIHAITERDDNLEDLSKYNKYLEESETYGAEIKELQSSIRELENETFRLRTQVSNKEMALSNYKSLHKDLDDFNSKYEDLNLLMEASSSRKGIPLFYIDLFMSNMKTIANDLLDIAYDGELFISKFDIQADKFNIPYIKNKREIEDISIASQGEQCFLSIAISFAMSYQSLLKYNIMLLDEVDGALDAENREKFIDVLEHQIDLIDADQVFLITHNNLFSMYPVDIIQLAGDSDKNYSLANYIPVKLE